MSTINSDGQRVGAMDRIHAAKMEIGSKVIHDTIKGVYEIEEVHSPGGVAEVKLKLLHKCVNMKQLWALLADGKARASGKAVEAAADLPSLDLAASTFSKAAPTRPPQSLASTASGGFGRS